jgi:RNase P subunit RPR2
MASLIRERHQDSIALRYATMLEHVGDRKEIVLPKTLKRECSDRALDE